MKCSRTEYSSSLSVVCSVAGTDSPPPRGADVTSSRTTDSRTTIVPATMSPNRFPDFEMTTLAMPMAYVPKGWKSMKRTRLRTAEAPNVTE